MVWSRLDTWPALLSSWLYSSSGQGYHPISGLGHCYVIHIVLGGHHWRLQSTVLQIFSFLPAGELCHGEQTCSVSPEKQRVSEAGEPVQGIVWSMRLQVNLKGGGRGRNNGHPCKDRRDNLSDEEPRGREVWRQKPPKSVNSGSAEVRRANLPPTHPLLMARPTS